MKSGFTLIELLITIAIIGMVTVLGVPAFSKYGERARFDQKVSEIKYGLEETHLSMLNPENGVNEYGLVASTGSPIVSMKKRTSTLNEYKKILLSSKDSITSGVMICTVADKKCVNSGGDTSGDLFALTNTSDGRAATFKIMDSPFGIEVEVTE